MAQPQRSTIDTLCGYCGIGDLEKVTAMLETAEGRKVVNDRDSMSDRTPLMWASYYGKEPSIVQELIKAGADVSLTSKSKKTALDYARKGVHPIIVATLKSEGRKSRSNSGLGDLTEVTAV